MAPRLATRRPSGLPAGAVPRPSARRGRGRAARWADPPARCPCPFWALVFVRSLALVVVRSGLWSASERDDALDAGRPAQDQVWGLFRRVPAGDERRNHGRPVAAEAAEIAERGREGFRPGV